MIVAPPTSARRHPVTTGVRADLINHPQSKINHRFAFTLIELLVAVSVLSLMMTLAARIFFDAQKGVQRGVQTSQIIAESRSVAQPLTDDVRNMNVFLSQYGSNSPGFLAIVQQNFGGVLYPIPDDPSVGPDGWLPGIDYDNSGTINGAEPAVMRSDQIGFFRDANNLEAKTPGEANRYDSDAKARHARVWVGHTSPVPDPPTDPSLDPGDAGYRLATDLALGRQALMLVENDDATTYPDGTLGTGTPGGSERLPPPNGSVSNAVFDGLHDVIDLRDLGGIGVYSDGGTDPAAAATRGLFLTPTYESPAVTATTSIYGNLALTPGGFTNLNYADAVLDWLFPVQGERLQAQTSLDTDFSAGIFDADSIAQLHAALAPHVADFAIEFAADWIDDWDTSGATPAPGSDGQPDYEPDRDRLGNLIWYTAPFYANPDSTSGNPFAPVSEFDGIPANPRLPTTYAAPELISQMEGPTGAGLFFLNPFMRVFNPATGNVTGTAADAHTAPLPENVAFVWAHTGDDPDTPAVATDPPLVEGAGKYWPYLIRYRFRLMDGRGEFRTIQTDPQTGEDYSEVGRWFELIVPVPRPQGLY
jgi:prepilin-type N-terminal cleavage/methylation domain-containing protein